MCFPLVEIGLTDWSKSVVAMAPLASPGPTDLWKMHECTVESPNSKRLNSKQSLISKHCGRGMTIVKLFK